MQNKIQWHFQNNLAPSKKYLTEQRNYDRDGQMLNAKIRWETKQWWRSLAGLPTQERRQ